MASRGPFGARQKLMRTPRHRVATAFLGLLAFACIGLEHAHGDGGKPHGSLYFLAGTPDAWRPYPVDVYRPVHGAPQLVRQVLAGGKQGPSAQGGGGVTLAADDQAGEIVVASPSDAARSNGPRIDLIHQDSPSKADSAELPSGAFYPHLVRDRVGMVILWVSLEGFRAYQVGTIPIQRIGGRREVIPASLQDLAGYRYEGVAYAPIALQESVLPHSISVRPNGVFMTYFLRDDPPHSPSGSVRLTPTSPPGLRPSEAGSRILAASDNYFVVEIPGRAGKTKSGRWPTVPPPSSGP